MQALRHPFVVLLTLPAGIAVAIGALPIPLVFLEHRFGSGLFDPHLVAIDVASARTVLSAIATGAMSALSLAYSLVLVVFTLAAGNIGPRLLKRFTSEIVNQVTAGILGGTFLYSIATLYYISGDFLPVVAVFGAGLLALLSVVQLIYFVRNVAASVTIDDEIAAISARLTRALAELRDGGSGGPSLQREQHDDASAEEEKTLFDEDWEAHSQGAFTAHRSGYIGIIDHARLVTFAREHDCSIRLGQPNGAFVLAGQPLGEATIALDDDQREVIADAVKIDAARSENAPVQFSVNLLVEIALRALSPGVNDSYTAIACVDGMTSAFATIADRPTEPVVYYDEEGTSRVCLPGLSLKEIVGIAFHPIRRSSGHNIMMMQALAQGLGRLHQAGGEEMREIIAHHASLVLRQLRAGEAFEEDIASVEELLPEPLVERISGEVRQDGRADSNKNGGGKD